jgi:hypothetical protein
MMPLGQQEPEGEVEVVAGRAHGDGKSPPRHTDLEWFLGRDRVRAASRRH